MERTISFSPHDKIKDKIGEILTYYHSYIEDLERIKKFYETNDTNEIFGDTIESCTARGDILVYDIKRLLRIHDLDEQIVARAKTLAEGLDLHNTVAHLQSEIIRLRKIREEIAQESIECIYKGLQEEISQRLVSILPYALKKHCPQLEMDAKLEKMLELRTKGLPR